MLNQINGTTLKKMIISAANNLQNNKQKVNDLNVFPVPDGDTGTNMSLTLMAAANELKEKELDSVYAVADMLATASLRGARGNSGVILSQLFRGFAKGMRHCSIANTKIFANSLKMASDTAYRAVMKPTEGTILTVAREAAEKAIEISKRSDDIVFLLKKVIDYANIVLNKTPEMLSVLKDAGVVDAGGKGLIYIFEGAFEYLKGNKIIETSDSKIKKIKPSNKVIQNNKDIKYAYCTEFLINKENNYIQVDKFKNIINKLGDCAMVINDTDVVKVHVHTNHPGVVIEEALKVGELTGIKIDNMKEQHNNIYVNNTKNNMQTKKFGFITVAVGEGIVNILKELGIDEIIEGGQTMNPSTNDIINAIDKLNAENIFVFPNNKNIIPTANQAKKLSDKNVFIIPTQSIPQCITCMFNFDENLSCEDNFNNMSEVLENVKTGQVTFAVRDTMVDGKEIKQNNILGLNNGKIDIVGKDIHNVCKQLLKKLVDEDSTIITLLYGKDIDEKSANSFLNLIQKEFCNCDVELHYGGQPLYYYIISVE